MDHFCYLIWVNDSNLYKVCYLVEYIVDNQHSERKLGHAPDSLLEVGQPYILLVLKNNKFSFLKSINSMCTLYVGNTSKFGYFLHCTKTTS